MTWQLFFLLYVVSESKDVEGIPSSIIPVTYDLVSLEIPYQHIASG